MTSYVEKEDPSEKVKMTTPENDPYEAEEFTIL